MSSGALHQMLAGGSRSGKTFLIVRAIIIRALRAPGSRHAILRHRRNAVKSAIWMDTLPKVKMICFPWLTWETNESDLIIRFENGSEIWLGGLDEKDRIEKILGTEFVTIFLNEVSQIRYSSVLIVITRLAQKVFVKGTFDELPRRMYYDLNPPSTGHWTYKLFVKKLDPETDRPLRDPSNYEMAYINPADNAANQPEGYLQSLADLPARQRTRFLDGKYQPDVPGALWSMELIDRCRCDPAEVPSLVAVVVGVDPSGASGDEDERSDEIGIVVCGLGSDGRGYLLADATVAGVGPAAWGAKVVSAWEDNQADRVVAEVNYGGDMVRFVVDKAAEARGLTVPVRKITATRGKAVRAEPVSALYEQDRIRIVGNFPKLEEQMINMSTDGYKGSKSPDRLDAKVWAFTDLIVTRARESRLTVISIKNAVNEDGEELPTAEIANAVPRSMTDNPGARFKW